MRKRRRLIRIGVLAGVAVILIGIYAGYTTWRVRSELNQARIEIARGRTGPAGRRLAALAAAHPGALGGAVDYWLAVSEAAQGRDDDALIAFARVPRGFPFEARGAYLEARANLQKGRLRAAERRLIDALGRGGPGLNSLRSLLVRVYEVEVRFADATGPIRDSLAESPNPVAVLRDLWTHDQPALPIATLRAALDQAAAMAPDDDRVWLGRARLEIATGRWEEALPWLRRCVDSPEGADDPVWIAWAEWARGADRPDEALRALRKLSPGRLDPARALEWRAWLLGRRGDLVGERKALERLIEIAPQDRMALGRLAELAESDGHADRAAEFRHRADAVGKALDDYRREIVAIQTTANAAMMGRLAEDAGRRRDARDWFALALAANPGDRVASASLRRLDAPAPKVGDLWADIGADASGKAIPSDGRRRLAFTDDAQAAGLKFVYKNGRSAIHQIPEALGGGVALLDFDGDGRLDVYLVQGGESFPNGTSSSAHPEEAGDRLFRNMGDGRFEDVTARAGLGGPRGFGFGVAVGDVDNDGFPDLFVTRWQSYALYRNNGNGTFEDVTVRSGLGGARGCPTSAAFADLDGDGDLDLYACHYCVWDADNPRICRDSASGAIMSCNPIEVEPEADHLFRNDGGRFVDVSAEAGIVDHDGRGLGVVASDLDDDGKIDLFVANDMSANYLWRNLGNFRFEEVGHLAGVAGAGDGGYRAGMGVTSGDFDGDGRTDLAVTNFYGESTSYYRNLGSGIFADTSNPSGIAAASRSVLGFGIAAFDADNDGRLDLATANGHVNDLRPHFPYLMPAQLLLNTGGRFRDASDRAGAPWLVPRMGRGLAVGDLDDDGRVDLLIVSQNQPLSYFHNRTDRNHFAVFRLEGRASNRDGIGARVALNVGGRRLVAERTGGGSYLSSSDPRLHFGLGANDRIASIEVTWPSGRIDKHQDLKADAGYLLREGETRPILIGGSAARSDGHRSELRDKLDSNPY